LNSRIIYQGRVATPGLFCFGMSRLKRGKNMTKRSAVADRIGEIAPKLTELTDDVLFGDVWQRPQLAPRDRSLATVSALVALNRTEQLPFHLRRALDNGVTKDELIELITHLAFYCGWPNSMSAVMIAKDVFAKA
jgi:4-carboxymuconolactone decarboxylase